MLLKETPKMDLFHDGFRQRMVQTGKQLTMSGWKNYQHIPSIYLHHLLFSPSSMSEIFRPVFARLLFLNHPPPPSIAK